MLKFKVIGDNGRILIGLGLSDENIKRMRKGTPMFFSLEALDLPGFDITILCGKTENDIKADLRLRGIKGI